MTTLLETTYEPTVADRINRVLYRLDQGELLTGGRLRRDDNFCVLGLFADESGLVEWDTDIQFFPDLRPRYHYAVDGVYYSHTLDRHVVELYNLANYQGRFDYTKAPENIKELIREHMPDIDDKFGHYVTISEINDHLLSRSVNPIVMNQVLAAIIRSGVIFKR